MPIEEALFYALGPAAILMVYAWLDEHWMNAYNTRESRQAMPPTKRLFELSPMIAIIGIALLFMGSVVHHALDNSGGWFALYFSFLVCGAFLPAAVMFRSVKNLVNWRAFSFTLLYVVATSVIWEVTLAVPRLWWGYRPEGMLHLYVPAWTPDVRRGIPVEAVMVWFAAPFVSVLTYEAVKLYLYIPNASIRERLWGRNN